MTVIIRETYPWVRSDNIKLTVHMVGSLMPSFLPGTGHEAALESHGSLYKGYFIHHTLSFEIFETQALIVLPLSFLTII